MRKLLVGVTWLAAGLLTGSAAGQSVMQIWNNNCMRCHGEKGEGGSAKSMLDDEWEFGGSPRELFDSVKKGHPDMGMEAFGETLSDAQIWGVVNYLYELRARAQREAGRGPKAQGGVFTSQHARYRVERVIERGLDTPWAVDFLPDGRMLVTNRSGSVMVHSTGKPGGEMTPLTGVPASREVGQGGMMDVAVHPKFNENRWVYLAFSKAAADGGRGTQTTIVRGTLEGSALTNLVTIFEAKPEHYMATGLHFGSRIAFQEDPKGGYFLFFCIGERGRAENAQNLELPNGKVHRVKDDGTIPADNPFVGREKAYETIWSYGHRNPQGLAFDLEGRLWVTEHGPRGGDELNLVEKAHNYGWPVVSFGINYNGSVLRQPFPDLAGRTEGGTDGITMPAYVWLPSVASCGLDTMRSGQAFAGWQGDLFAGGLAGETVERLRVRDGKVTEVEEVIYNMGRVRDVVCSPDGLVYVVLNGPDAVIRLVPAP